LHKARLIIIPLILTGVISAIVYFTRDKSDATKIVLSGNIEVTDARLSFQIAGLLDERYVNEGESVEEGDLIATLASADQEIAVALAEAGLSYANAVLSELQAGSRPEDISRAAASVQQARASLELLQNGSRSQEIASAEADLSRAQAGVDAAQSQLNQAESDLARFNELYIEGVIAEREFTAVSTQYELAIENLHQAEAVQDAAQQKLDLFIEGARPEQIDQARAALNQAQAGYSIVLEGPRPETIEQAMAQFDIANENLNKALQLLEYTNLYAPYSGIVLSKSVEPGEWVSPGTPVVTIGALDTVYLQAYISETSLGRISLGQQVNITADSYPGKQYSGTISFISNEAEFTPKTVQTSEERVKLTYLVKITLENPGHELKPGMPADCVIDLNRE
jgi:HlyD family secretion protein